MSQQSPIPLLKVILKYVKTIKDDSSEMKCKWILYWEDLEKFAVYWCFDFVKSKEKVDDSVSTHPLYANITVRSMYIVFFMIKYDSFDRFDCSTPTRPVSYFIWLKMSVSSLSEYF